MLAYVGKGKGGRYDPFQFGVSLDAAEVEISDEMFLLTGEEAKKHVEPPRLTTLIVAPAQATVEPGKKQTFTAKGLDQHGHDLDPGKVAWIATGGTMEQDGVFLAGRDEGNFLVTAAADNVKGGASVTVTSGSTPPPLAQAMAPKGLQWEGEIPPPKNG